MTTNNKLFSAEYLESLLTNKETAVYWPDAKLLVHQLADTLRKNEMLMRNNERLRMALEYAIWQHEGGGSAIHGHWPGKARDALSYKDRDISTKPSEET